MINLLKSIILFLSSVFILTSCNSVQIENNKEKSLKIGTVWQIKPSMKFDALCLLNTLTGDLYYVHRYQHEFAYFEPKLTRTARVALGNLKRIIKDENQGIISAFLSLYFSATEDSSLDDMLKTLANSSTMKNNLKQTSYYSEEGWEQFESIKQDLEKIFLFLKDINFESYWEENILPKVNQKIKTIAVNLPKYDVIREVESHLGYELPSNTITVYMLYYSQPHGIKITGTRFLTDVAWPFEIVLRNAIHEMMHPPFNLDRDAELKSALKILKADTFLMDKVLNHNPAFGYNSFEGFIEEDWVQTLDQLISENLNVAHAAKKRWKENDNGMHVLAVSLYSLTKTERYNKNEETFRDFFIRMAKSGKLSQGAIKRIYDDMYSSEL